MTAQKLNRRQLDRLQKISRQGAVKRMVTLEEEDRIVELVNEGKSKAEVSRIVKRDRKVIIKVCKFRAKDVHAPKGVFRRKAGHQRRQNIGSRADPTAWSHLSPSQVLDALGE
jgi:hypothetical protein